jgi:small subunit ribosomal protein S9
MVEKTEDEKKKKGRARKAAAKEPQKEEAKPPVKAEEAPKAEEPKKAEAPRRRKKAAPKKAARKVFVARGKRKESVARATISEGKGAIRINSRSIASINNPYIADIVREPLRYVGPEANNIDISVNVRGGGTMGQAQAARTAIANALVMYFEGMNLREKFIDIDRSLVIEDTRRVEPKKFRGPKARARFQKSYR